MDVNDLDRLGDALEELADDVRHFLRLAVVDGLGYREIADAVGVPHDVVVSRLRSGMLQLSSRTGGRGLVA